jgi:sporulation protein YlmC with PRC-barrel domain
MQLQPLGSIDNSAVAERADLRGWRVISQHGLLLGLVAEVIVDVEHGAPIYLNIAPTRDSMGAPSGEECWIRVPYRYATLDENARLVVLSDAATLGLGTATAGLLLTRRA